ncbi:MAG: PAS domain S-box protein [Pseudomonadota bacterium]|nr:PAS domain S-box protein [Pseudomonadota bacterium]
MLTVFALIVALQLLVAVLSIDMLSAVRAYVTGESLYSKGQKDAQIYLIDYAEFHREEDYRRFLAAIAVPLGDRAAREELQKRHPDLKVARQGLLDGGTDDSDIPGVIRLFQLFHKTPLMAGAIATWTEGDGVIEQMRVLAGRAHEQVIAGNLRDPAVVDMRDEALALNKRLTALENKFAAQLGEAARLSQRLLLGLNLALALLLGLTGLAFVRYSSRVQAATEDEVRRRQESLQRLLDSSAEGLYGVDTRGRCTFINRAALQMLGYAGEAELLGRDMHALIHHSYPDGRPRPTSKSRIAVAWRERRDLHVTDEMCWRRDGTSFPVEYWSHPMLKDGQLDGAVATFFDISERLHMQAALRQGEIRIAGLVDAVNDGVITVDPEDRIVLFNRAAERLFGVSAVEAIGSGVERFIPRRRRNGRDVSIRGLRLSATRPGGAIEELAGLRENGEEFPLEASLSGLETEGGTLVTAVLRDITDLQTARAERQALEALEASSRAKSEFLSRMSHELRTPLNAVLGFSQLLRLDASQPPTLRQLERIQHIENAGAHLLALVNDVLDLSRVDSGQMTVTLEPVALGTVTDDALAMVVPLAAEAGIELRVVGADEDSTLEASLDDGDVRVMADRVRLRQVLVNLLSNAVKYNRPGGRVRVSWGIHENHCNLRIADNGFGMSPEKVARLFEPFNRLGAERSGVEGTGIGLVLSRRLAELMHGELRVESAVGKGTVATLTLIRSYEPSAQPSSLAPPSQHGELDQPLRVLYAEDNEVNVELVRQVVMLRPSVVLDVAVNGAQALAQARRDAPELMLVDMNLGDMTGLEVAQALRADAATAGIRLVALSADALPEQIDAALAAGFEGYLTKPLNFRALLDVLDGRTPR